MSLFILIHAFGFDSLRSKWNAPIFFFIPCKYLGGYQHVLVRTRECIILLEVVAVGADIAGLARNRKL
jgi:hypothetical protein